MKTLPRGMASARLDVALVALCAVAVAVGIVLTRGRAPSADDAGPPPQRTSIDNEVLEVACGQCMFDMGGDGCDLAVRVDGRAYFVDGTDIDDHGDAHAADGFCNAVRQARVTGSIENGRFRVTAMEVLASGE